MRHYKKTENRRASKESRDSISKMIRHKDHGGRKEGRERGKKTKHLRTLITPHPIRTNIIKTELTAMTGKIWALIFIPVLELT